MITSLADAHAEIIRLTAERDRALKTRDLAQEASTRDLEAKRAVEVELARITAALWCITAAREAYRTASQNHMARCAEQEKEIKSLKQRVAKLGEALYFTPGEPKF